MKGNDMRNVLIGLAALGAIGMVGCSSTNTAITSAICVDATTLQTSGLALNKNQSLALQGIITTCTATGGGTSFNNATLALAIIQDAILLQSSGLLTNVHITAEAPEHQQVLRKIKTHWERLAAEYR